MTQLPDLQQRIGWVRNDSELQQACSHWLQVDALAIDTEFVRRRTFYPIPALLQFYDGDDIVIVDPLSITDWQPLAEVLSSQTVVKIFHAAGEDLEVFWRLVGLIPAPLFDTQVAAGLCGLRPSMGYNKLVAQLCSVELPKDETQSDWLARPLSEGQVQYAAYDVWYLYQMYQQLSAIAADKGRQSWVLQDSARLGVGLSTLIEPDQYYRKLKGVQRLSAQELVVARALCSWREEKARQRDLPRNWVLKDSAIVALARSQPQTNQQLTAIKDLPPATVRKQGRYLLELIEQAGKLPPEHWPEVLPEPPHGAVKESLKRVQEAVKRCAEELALAPELLMNRKQMGEAALYLLQGEQQLLPAGIGQWRSEILASPLNGIERP